MLRRNFLSIPLVHIFAKPQEKTNKTCDEYEVFIKIKTSFINAEKQFGVGSILYLGCELYKLNKDNINICIFHKGIIVDRVVENVDYDFFKSIHKDFNFWLKEREK